METQQARPAPFGEKLFEASCKVIIPPEQFPVDAVAEVWTLGLLLKPSSGNTLFIAYTESPKIEATNYRATVATGVGLITLSQFGTKYERFAQQLTDSCGEALAKALLMEDSNFVYEASCFSSMPPHFQSVQSRIRIYDTALVILPLNHVPIRIPLSLRTVDLQTFKIKLTTSGGEIAEISRLGNATQFFYDKLKETKKRLEESTLETIKGMVPSASFEELGSLSSLMIEGRAAPRKAVEGISTGLWQKLEKSVELSPLSESYHYLSTIGFSDLESLGLRKTLNSVYLWLMIPVMATSNREGGNAIVMEITSEKGHATYLFRVMPRNQFPMTTHEEFAKRSEILIRDLNEAIIATGFRREPIYLSDEQLNRPEYSKYLYASQHLEPLKLLRDRFFARIVHNTFNQWKDDLNEALHFNTSERADSDRWPKVGSDFIESSSSGREE